MKKILSLLALVLMSCMGAWADYTDVTSLPTTLEESKQAFMLVTRPLNPRGTLYAGESDNYLRSTAKYTDKEESTTNSEFQFLLLKAEGTNAYYIYSVAAKKFFGARDNNNNLTLVNSNPTVYYIWKSSRKTGYSWTIGLTNNTVNENNANANATINVTNWDNTYGVRFCGTSGYDDGNEFCIANAETVSDAVLYEAYAKAYPNFVSEYQTKIDAALSHSGQVGYPTDMSSLNQYATNGVTNQNVVSAITALNAVYALTDVNLPEDGKAYYIKAKFHDDSYKYLAYPDGNTGFLTLADEANTMWVAKNVGDKYAFVDASTGKYLYVESLSYKNNTTDKTVYDAKALLTIAKVNPNRGESSGNATSEELFGCLTIKGKSLDDHTFVLLASQDNNFRHDDASFYYYDCAMGTWNSTFYRSCEFIFEEVENPNVIKLTKPASTFEGGLNGKFVGTFSAPYAVELPEGVVAYTANLESNNVTFEELGNIVPKNTGVVLYAADAEDAINEKAVPAAATVDVEATNLLEGTNGADVTVGADVNAYIMSATAGEGVKFYKLSSTSRKVARNKAYLVAPSAESNILNFRFDFESSLTEIEATKTSEVAAPIYDLQGRRVQNVKSGLYIVNGKKVIR